MPAPSLQLLAPAKLNLFLHITGRRADGYHTLQSVFQLLDFGDQLTFQLQPDADSSLHLRSSGNHGWIPLEQNLVMRAARKLQALAEPGLPGVRITIEKRIPVGGGLGGGSSNAAMTLIALNTLWELQLDNAALCTIGKQLGADVPIFIRGQSAWAEGIGDLLEPVALPPAWYLVLTPSCQVPTREIFCHTDLTRNTPAIKMADFLAGRVRNDCEPVTCRLYPEVAAALNWLGNFAKSRMTGTGASVFAAFSDEASARKVFDEIPADWHGFVARGVNSLPHSYAGN